MAVTFSEWCKEYNESIDINVGEMQREVDQYMEEYDEKVKEVSRHFQIGTLLLEDEIFKHRGEAS